MIENLGISFVIKNLYPLPCLLEGLSSLQEDGEEKNKGQSEWNYLKKSMKIKLIRTPIYVLRLII